MEHTIFFRKVEAYLLDDMLEEAIECLYEVFQRPETSALSGRLKKIKNDCIKGKINYEIESNERSKVRADLLDHCNRLKFETMNPDSYDFSAPTESLTATATSTLNIEITIDRDFNSYSKDEQAKLLAAISNLLQLKGEIKIKNKRAGSVVLTLELTPEQCETLHWAIQRGEFEEFDVLYSEIKKKTTLGHSDTILHTEQGKKKVTDLELSQNLFSQQKNSKLKPQLVSHLQTAASELQGQQLLELLREARHTTFGLEYDFHKIMMADDPIGAFKKAVPATDYNGIYERWWSKSHLEDAPDVCWPGVVPFYALLDGTAQTASKYIPVTEGLIRGIKRGSRRLFFGLSNYEIPASDYTKQLLMIGSCTQLQRQGNHWLGNLSGIMRLNLPFVIERNFMPGRHITDIPEWGDRIEMIADEAPGWDIGFSVSNPMWLELVLERIIEKHKLSHIHELWPNFSLFVHEGVMLEYYKPALEQLFGQPMQYMNIYATSEGFLGYQQHPDKHSLRFLFDCGVFFEFIPFTSDNFDENGNLKSDQPESFRIDEVQTGVPYALLLSTTAGAWRYLLEDTVQITNIEQSEFIIVGRTKQFPYNLR